MTFTNQKVKSSERFFFWPKFFGLFRKTELYLFLEVPFGLCVLRMWGPFVQIGLKLLRPGRPPEGPRPGIRVIVRPILTINPGLDYHQGNL